MPQEFSDVGELVEAALRRLGPRIVLGLPLGVGKPVAIANEFFRRVARDPRLSLTIVTALSLRKPAPGSELERRFAGPLLDRIFGSYQDLDYVLALRANALPPNIKVIEFFLEPGANLNIAASQQNYLSANYTHAARELLAHGVNCLAQLIARRGPVTDPQYSLGSNTDVTLDLLALQPADAERRILVIGQVHEQMPFMLGRGLVPGDMFEMVLDSRAADQDLFCPPNPALASVDHAISLHASALVADGGTLQIGIGELGDGICYALLLRQQQNPDYRQALRDLGSEHVAPLIDALGGREPFREGLFASTEMFVDQMLDLYRGGILRRRVYESLELTKLIARGNIAGGRFDARILSDLLSVGMGPRLSEAEFEKLKYYGVFRSDTYWQDGRIQGPDGELIAPDLADERARAQLAESCIGRELQRGAVVHAGFFLGPRGFYANLHDLSESERILFDMRGVGYINQLYGADYEQRVLQRTRARFVNTTMMVTLSGAAVSDGLDDGRVVSGVGGQYNFVAMAHALPDARSILCLRATRRKDGVVSSNIVYNYGHVTIPRHLRDIVVTEYGIADLRGRTDSEIIAALLNITDSRFQTGLLARAKAAGKIAADYRIPEIHCRNTPEQLERALSAHRRAGRFSEYPFGTDLTAQEIELAHSLKRLALMTENRAARLWLAARALLTRPRDDERDALRRMDLGHPASFNERLLRGLVALGLRAERRAR
jgi:acyl-CoA hydrolase